MFDSPWCGFVIFMNSPENGHATLTGKAQSSLHKGSVQPMCLAVFVSGCEHLHNIPLHGGIAARQKFAEAEHL